MINLHHTSPLWSPSLGAPRALTDVYGPGVAADTPVICSAGGTDLVLLVVLRDGGLSAGRHRPCGSSAAKRSSSHAFREAIGDGLLISMEYPQPTTLCPDERAVKSAQLVGHLNKASVSTFVDPRFQARRSALETKFGH